VVRLSPAAAAPDWSVGNRRAHSGPSFTAAATGAAVGTPAATAAAGPDPPAGPARQPAAHLTTWRLLLARKALATTDAGLTEIAARVGSGSQAAFSRAFQRELGQSPDRWRRAQGQAP
jgi:AraC-like DNA-binding protein